MDEVMKETVFNMIREKFIQKSAEDPAIMEAMDELRKSMVFVNGSFIENAYVNVDSDAENYILGSRLKYLMNLLDYSIMFDRIIDEESGRSITYISTIKKDCVKNLRDNGKYVIYVFNDSITLKDISDITKK